MAERYETQVLNYGGGSQTVVTCILIANGILPKPDRIIAADTGREVQSTWDYLRNHMQPWLAANGIDTPIEVASHDLATVDLYGKNGDMLLPVFTATGKLETYCSGEWKTRVVQRHLRSTGVTSATNWIGYAFDEKARWGKRKAECDGPWRTRFPLVELGIVKADCGVIIRKAGLPPVHKSRCWMCPNQPNAEWRELKERSPEEFEAACVLDEEYREEDEQHAVYLHQSRVPLREADLDAPDRKEPSRQCTLGICFV